MVLAVLLLLAGGQQTGLGPEARTTADRAYAATRERDWYVAQAAFRQALQAAGQCRPPADCRPWAALHKDRAYALLKMGENEAAREEFEAAFRLDPEDTHAALEFAFLCHETQRRAEARRVFDRLRRQGNATAETAFRNIDMALAEGIARWSAVARAEPANLSAHRELARLAEDRDDLELAARHAEAAWRLRPDDRELLLELGRLWAALGRTSEAHTAMLAASRGASPRAADRAREYLPARYPYVSEFRAALAFEPGNVDLRRELGYLLLAMGRASEAEQEFRRVLERAPSDRLASAQIGLLLLARGERDAATPLLEHVLATGDDELAERVRTVLRPTPRLMERRAPQLPSAFESGERSYRAGMLQDALKYFSIAHEEDPLDFAVMLRLGRTYNMLRDDARAIHWFRLAGNSPDTAVAAEASRAWRNLRPAQARIRTTAWAFPMWSSRWHDLFTYAQVKTEFRLPVPLQPYLSVRFIGDTRAPGGAASPEFYSETAFVLAAGVIARPARGLTLWGEAGEAISYRRRPGRMVPDFRGGASWSRGWGAPLGGEAPGWFAETTADAVFLSRFDNDVLLYSQSRAGYTLPPLGPVLLQGYANTNLVTDARRQYWANTAEFGPGLRFRLQPVPATFSLGLLRGVYTRNEGNPRRPNFFDFRAGAWYAFTR